MINLRTYARDVVSRSDAELTGGSAMKTKMNKKLSLSRETVRELTDGQLNLAAGGNDSGDSIEACCITQGCHQSRPTYICNTYNSLGASIRNAEPSVRTTS